MSRIVHCSAAHPDAVALIDAYFAELRERLGDFDPAKSVSASADELGPPSGAFIVLYEGNRPVGCGGLKTHAPGEGELKRMFVAPDCRGRGHARRILTALEDAARALGHRRLVLDTAAPLQEAMALYTKAGYRRIEAYNDNRYAAAWFEKQLSSK